MRLFIALDLAEESKKLLAARIDPIFRALTETEARFASRVPPEKLHLTLKYLGTAAEDQVEKIKSELKGSFPEPFPHAVLRVEGLVAFPSAARAQVLAWTFDRNSALFLAEAAAQVESTCTRLGFAPEGRPFRPHVTHLRWGRTRARAGSLKDLMARTEVRPFEINSMSLTLYRSEILPGGSRYTVLATF